MTKTGQLSIAALLVAAAACGAPAAVAQDTAAEPTVEVPSEAEFFKTVCSIAVKDLDAGVSIYVEEGWEVVNCSPWVNPMTDGPAPIIGHCCYLSR